jgi:hypothetical protein
MVSGKLTTSLRHHIRDRVRHRIPYDLPHLHSAAATAKRRRLKVSAPLRLDSRTRSLRISSASLIKIILGSWKCPPVAPHPDVGLEKPAAHPAVLPGIISSASRNMVSKAVRNRIVKISLEVARKEGNSTQNVLHWADIECWELGGCPFVNHRDTTPVHAAVWGERYDVTVTPTMCSPGHTISHTMKTVPHHNCRVENSSQAAPGPASLRPAPRRSCLP